MKRSEIWLLNLNPIIGAEIGKTRPVVIISDDDIGVLPLKIIAPITDWKDRYNNHKWMLRVDPDAQNNLSKPSAIDAFQLRSVSQLRFIHKMGDLSDAQMQELTNILALTLSII